MKEIEYKIDALDEMLREDGYNGSNIVIQTLNELREQLKNCNVPVSASTVIKELHEALTNLLEAADDEGWMNDETGEDWEEQSEARKALANVPEKYLR